MIRLTFEIKQDPETPSVWVGHCVELDVVSAGTSPLAAMQATASAVAMLRASADIEAMAAGFARRVTEARAACPVIGCGLCIKYGDAIGFWYCPEHAI
jgi:hypothetical protein